MGSVDFLAGVLSTLLVGAAVLVAARTRPRHGQASTLEEPPSPDEQLRAHAEQVLANIGMRYQVKVRDWGPDFDGQDGRLPRWRWSVQDADWPMKVVLGHPDTADPKALGLLMLGNAQDEAEAYTQALMWVRAHSDSVVY